jgi:type IX secretion system PorP/SprF family membrane protein
MKKIVLGISCALFCTMALHAQDVHFTQYFTSPLTLNPAMTGLIAEDLRVSANYRSQWTSVSTSYPYTTATFSFELAALKGKLPEGDALGIGLMGLYDKSGSGGLTNTTVGGSLAYHKAFGRERQQHISFGMQVNMVQKSIDQTKLIFEDMYNVTTGTVSAPGTSMSAITTPNLSYPDFNAGVMYSGKIAEHATGYFGYSYYHLTQPTEGFISSDSHEIHKRQTAYIGGSFDLAPTVILYTSALYQSQATAEELLMGGAVGFILNPNHDEEYAKNTIFYLGGWYRYRDALAPYVAIEWSRMRIGFSYDVNVSAFAPATHGLGGYELSLIFLGRINRGERNPVYNWSCPKLF